MSKKNKQEEPETEKKIKADSLTFKNLHVNFLYTALDIPLHGEQRRARTRFAEQLRKKLEEIERERIETIKKFAEKDEKGEPKIKEDANYDITPENLIKFNEEYRAFLYEDYIIDVLPSNKQNLRTVRDILRSSTKAYNTAEGEIFDKILDEFEKI